MSPLGGQSSRVADVSAAITGSVASAARYLIKAILRGHEHIPQICGISQKAFENARGNIASSKGIGVAIIARFLIGVPGMNESAITHQLVAKTCLNFVFVILSGDAG